MLCTGHCKDAMQARHWPRCLVWLLLACHSHCSQQPKWHSLYASTYRQRCWTPPLLPPCPHSAGCTSSPGVCAAFIDAARFCCFSHCCLPNSISFQVLTMHISSQVLQQVFASTHPVLDVLMHPPAVECYKAYPLLPLLRPLPSWLCSECITNMSLCQSTCQARSLHRTCNTIVSKGKESEVAQGIS